MYEDDIFGDAGFDIDTLENFGTDGNLPCVAGPESNLNPTNEPVLDVDSSGVNHLYTPSQKKNKKKKRRGKNKNKAEIPEVGVPDPAEIGENLVQTDGGCDERHSRLSMNTDQVEMNEEKEEEDEEGDQEMLSSLGEETTEGFEAPSCDYWNSLAWILQCDGGDDSGSSSDSDNGLGNNMFHLKFQCFGSGSTRIRFMKDLLYPDPGSIKAVLWIRIRMDPELLPGF